MRYERWETPVSDARSLAMVSLVDHDGLRVTVQDLRDPARRRFEFKFTGVAAYRNILEEYRTREVREVYRTGWTAIVAESPWLAEVRARESLLDVYQPGCRHFAIETEDDVLDVLTADEPEIREVEPGAPNDPLPGKSRVLFHPEDRQEIDRLWEELRRNNQPPPPGTGDGGSH